MAAAYPYELRKRVLNAYEKGLRITTIKEIFNVSRNTIYKWLKIKDKTGDIKAKEGYQKGHSHKVKNMEEFRNFIILQDKCLNRLLANTPIEGERFFY